MASSACIAEEGGQKRGREHLQARLAHSSRGRTVTRHLEHILGAEGLNRDEAGETGDSAVVH